MKRRWFIIINPNEQKEENKKESQYLLRVVYDSEDKNVHKLLEGIFGPDQMLDVKNGKIAKINSSLTPEERDCFFSLIAEALNKIGFKKVCDENIEDEKEEETENSIDQIESDITKEEKDENDSRKVSADKLIKEFATFINNIS